VPNLPTKIITVNIDTTVLEAIDALVAADNPATQLVSNRSKKINQLLKAQLKL
jgi:metal-responsive CopG/Arc/MetJ family transcriptional regulator